MSFQKTILICLLAIIAGGVGGLLEVKFNRPEQATVSQRLVSDKIGTVRIDEQSTASVALVEEEALRREKAAGLAEFLENYPEIESK